MGKRKKLSRSQIRVNKAAWKPRKRRQVQQSRPTKRGKDEVSDAEEDGECKEKTKRGKDEVSDDEEVVDLTAGTYTTPPPPQETKADGVVSLPHCRVAGRSARSHQGV
jgi:hypothetical protein